MTTDLGRGWVSVVGVVRFWLWMLTVVSSSTAVGSSVVVVARQGWQGVPGGGIGDSLLFGRNLE